MDINKVNEYLNKLSSAASNSSLDEFQIKYSYEESMGLDIFEGEVSNYENSITQLISLSGKKDGQMGGAATSSLDEEFIPWLIDKTISAIELTNDEDENFFNCDPEHPNLESVQLGGAYDKNTYDKFKEIGLLIEKKLLEADSRIVAVDYLSLNCSRGPAIRRNSLGLNMYTDEDLVTIGAGIRAVENGITKSFGKSWYGQDIDEFDVDEFVNDLVAKAMAKFGGSSVKSGTYDVILHNKVAIKLFGSFLSSFSSYQMCKDLSVLKGKEGSRIASECLTFAEVPMYDKAIFKVPFDDEGVLTTEKNIIENGVFKTALYDIKTQHMTGVKSTGNGFGGIDISNVMIVPDESVPTLEELAGIMGEGILITDISGLHAGLNPISGDFSLLSEGFRVVDGKIGQAVEQITMSGNFFEMINRIGKIGGDVDKTMGSNGEFFAPSIIIKDVAIAGE